MALFERSVEIQREAGLRSRLIRANELQELVPHISPDGLEGGLFGPDDGFLDPHDMRGKRERWIAQVRISQPRRLPAGGIANTHSKNESSDTPQKNNMPGQTKESPE